MREFKDSISGESKQQPTQPTLSQVPAPPPPPASSQQAAEAFGTPVSEQAPVEPTRQA